MKNLNSTAKTMDTVFNVLEILAKIAFVGIIVGLIIIAVGFAFDLDPDRLGTGYGTIEVGSLELQLAENAIPRCNIVWLYDNEEYRPVLENFLTVLFEANPASIGGKMPGDDFYTCYYP